MQFNETTGPIRRRILTGGLVGMAIPLLAKANLALILGNMTSDRLELEVRILDESGEPLAGSSIWLNDHRNIGLRFGMPDLNDIQRMANRYANQTDFLSIGDIPGFAFERTDKNGVFREYRVANRGSDIRHPYIIAAVKRGYFPGIAQGVASLNQHHLVEIRLQRDQTVLPIDAKMEAFDQLMAQARTVTPGEDVMSEARMVRLQSINQRVRALAEDLEHDGRGDDASAVYWALADFPSITREVTPEGQVIVGYANGRTDAKAEEDRLRAARLNTQTPKLLINKIRLQQGFPVVGISSAAQGQAYLAAFESLWSGPFKERILPSTHRIAIYQALRWGTPDQACDLLNRAYRFEPYTMSLKDWWARLKDIEKRRAELKLPAANCIIEGLPPL